VVKGAFTLIELIFAIVVISITVVSLPMMNQATSKGIDANLVQEAIFAAATVLNETVTAHWDENSMEDGSSLARVIDVDGDCDTTTKLKPGHIYQPYHRRCRNDLSNVVAENATEGFLEAMETSDTALTDSASASGYKKAYTVSVDVSTGTTFGTLTSDNIKLIKVDVKDSIGIITSLKTYSANIGEVDYYKKTY